MDLILDGVVPGGGLSPDGTRWIACRLGFFLPVRVLSRLFRRCFLESLQNAFDAGQLHFSGSLQALSERDRLADHLDPVRRSEGVVYAKRPFAGPAQVLDYVGRSTHRVAFANHRLIDLDDGHVRFRYKDYRAEAPDLHKTMTLAAPEFIRRLLLHVLPPGFHRIRYYGFLGNRHRSEKLAQCRDLLGTPPPPAPIGDAAVPADYRDRAAALTGCSLRVCPRCRDGQMQVVECAPPAAHRCRIRREAQAPPSLPICARVSGIGGRVSPPALAPVFDRSRPHPEAHRGRRSAVACRRIRLAPGAPPQPRVGRRPPSPIQSP